METYHLPAETLDWLLEPADPGVRCLALRDIVRLAPDDPELEAARQRAHTHGPIAALLDCMEPEGWWQKPGPGYNPKYFSTVWNIILLAQLGADVRLDERLERACTYLLDHALSPGGQLTATGAPSGTADCLQGNLCWALAELGCTDPRLDTAWEWMARTVTGEGLARVGEKIATPPTERGARKDMVVNMVGRYYAGKCGPLFACGSNNKLPCAWGGVKVLLALGKIPAEQRSPLIEAAIQAGVDFLFSVDPASAAYPTGWGTKPNSSWWKLGFPVFYVTDILQIVEALAPLGYGSDPRLETTLELVRQKSEPDGRWKMEYDLTGKMLVDFGPKRAPNKWVTLRAVRALLAAGYLAEQP